MSQAFSKVAVKIEGHHVVAEVHGFRVRAGLDLKKPQSTFNDLLKLFKEAGLELTNEEKGELLRQFNISFENYLAQERVEEGVEERKPLFVFQDEKGKTQVKILESDGIRLDVASLAYAGEHEIVVGELSYAYALLKKVDGDEPFEVETVEPVVAIAKYRDGSLVERSINSPRFLKTLDVEGRKALIMMKTRALTPLETL